MSEKSVDLTIRLAAKALRRSDIQRYNISLVNSICLAFCQICAINNRQNDWQRFTKQHSRIPNLHQGMPTYQTSSTEEPWMY